MKLKEDKTWNPKRPHERQIQKLKVLEKEKEILILWAIYKDPISGHLKENITIEKSEEQVLEETIERSRENKAQQIYENMALYLQDLNLITKIEPIMPIEITSRTWKEKLDHVCEKIEAINPQIQLNAHV
ncbi:26344_t:CDS:2 [Gigaspora margarita]|uniref:26344_t:CDS:1 n=1 Tax=Gigaspora margarita TaxID=4874 RepID=A0ABN7UM46_GIGMA|nr:26344_t:CDS:2 [Gigaspora margarita]